MKNYIIKTLMVSLLPKESIPEDIIITLPNNVLPIGIEVRPVSFPEGLFIHHLIPCDESGNPIEETITTNIYEAAWNELSKCFGEKMQQEELDLMDSVLKGVKLEMESDIEAKKEADR